MRNTGPGEMSSEEAAKIARFIGARNQNGGLSLTGIILSIAAFGIAALIAIGAYGLVSLIDLKTEFAGVKEKVEILYSERKRP